MMAETEPTLLSPLSPFRIEPRFVGRVWGYQDLRPWYDRRAEGEPLGEVWLTGDDCTVATGPHAGQSLGSLFAAAPEAMLGAAASSPGSPLLVKMIFAREKLSVQVHPDDAMAQKYGEPRGKTECWYALAAEPGAQVAAGLKPGVTLDQVKAGIHEGTLEESLNVLPVSTGDMIFVDAGTVHAIWPGSILLETQQNCDLTYRMYDYGRPRELHIDKSLEATRLTTNAGKVQPSELADRTVLIDVEYFRVERLPVAGSRLGKTLPSRGEPAHGLCYLFAAAGAGRLIGPDFDPIDLPMWGIVAIPASSPAFVVLNLGGLDLIRIAPRWPKQRAWRHEAGTF
ncbi:MAG TPA: class I mannose-6-phosphate isomerase [Terracidiphilus sp.]|nr:class I mannose-6-phosphate isomerase [Terracidiphilus sp.]